MYYFCEVHENKTYGIRMTNKFYSYTEKFYCGDSYYNMMFRLFGLLPKDFFHYISSKYNAKFEEHPSLKNYIRTVFTNKEDAEKLCRELNRRFQICVKRGDFS